MEVEDLKHGPFEPAAACSQCKVKWMESGVEALIQATKWDKIRQRSDVEALVGVGVWVCGYVGVISDFFHKDPRLQQLGCAIRGAQLHGFTNGLSKALSWRLVDIVIQHGLCSNHSLSLHV